MRNIIHLSMIVSFLLLALATIVGESRFVPRPDKVHFGSITYPRRWGSWCSEDDDCGLGFCLAYMCQCYPGYITWYFMETCAYEQRRKLTAFLLSFFLGMFGVDWFVLSRGNAGYIIAGIIKLIISSICCIGWPVAAVNRRKKSDERNSFVVAISIGLTAVSLIWWLIDWIRILANVFYDGYGAPLQPWGEDYFDGRIPYRV